MVQVYIPQECPTFDLPYIRRENQPGQLLLLPWLDVAYLASAPTFNPPVKVP